jgi:hypothetical protein
MAGPLEPTPAEGNMTGSARNLPWSLVAPVPGATPGGFSLSRRTLYRTLAAALALAAITPLFAAEGCDSDQRGRPLTAQAQPH